MILSKFPGLKQQREEKGKLLGWGRGWGGGKLADTIIFGQSPNEKNQKESTDLQCCIR